MKHTWNLQPLYKWGQAGWVMSFQIFLKMEGFQIFPINLEGLVKYVGLSIIFILINPFQCYLSLSVSCVCVCMFVLFIYTISISIICVSQEEPSLIVSNQQVNYLQVNNFWKEKPLHSFPFDVCDRTCTCQHTRP